MVRLERYGLAARSARASSRVTNRKSKPYKIVFESVTQEKKKLRSAISYNAQAPSGYDFVPAGIPELSEFCKELCRKRGLVVHIVSAKPKNKASTDPEKISHHVHRIGHHFPNAVVDQACDWLGYSFRGGTYRKDLDIVGTSRLARSLAGHSKRLGLDQRKGSEQENKEQVRAAIRDLFPKIPDEDLHDIVNHAFREGTSRVGNASELSLPRKVQLAVVAHIRHVYTDYDKLLKTGTYLDARSKVEQACLDQLVEWRGENQDGEAELEDTFRETIVIDDEDEDEDETEDESVGDGERGQSLEIVSRQAAAHDLQPEEYAPIVYPGNARSYRASRRILLAPRPESYLGPVTRSAHQRTIFPQHGSQRYMIHERLQPEQTHQSRSQPSRIVYETSRPQPRRIIYTNETRHRPSESLLRGQEIAPMQHLPSALEPPRLLHQRPSMQHRLVQPDNASRYVEYERVVRRPPVYAHHANERILPEYRTRPAQVHRLHEAPSEEDQPIPSIEKPELNEHLPSMGSHRSDHDHVRTVPPLQVNTQHGHDPMNGHAEYLRNEIDTGRSRRNDKSSPIPREAELYAATNSKRDYDPNEYDLSDANATHHSSCRVKLDSPTRRPFDDHYQIDETRRMIKNPFLVDLTEDAKPRLDRYEAAGRPVDSRYEIRHVMPQAYVHQQQPALSSPIKGRQFENTFSQAQHTERVDIGVRHIQKPLPQVRHTTQRGTRLSEKANEIREGSSESPIVIDDSPPHKRKHRFRGGPEHATQHQAIVKRPQAGHRTRDRPRPVHPDQPASSHTTRSSLHGGRPAGGVVAERDLANDLYDNY